MDGIGYGMGLGFSERLSAKSNALWCKYHFEERVSQTKTILEYDLRGIKSVGLESGRSDPEMSLSWQIDHWPGVPSLQAAFERVSSLEKICSRTFSLWNLITVRCWSQLLNRAGQSSLGFTQILYPASNKHIHVGAELFTQCKDSGDGQTHV